MQNELSRTRLTQRSNVSRTMISVVFTQLIESKCMLECWKSENSANISLVETVRTTSKSEGCGEKCETTVEDGSRVVSRLGRSPDTGTATHVGDNKIRVRLGKEYGDFR
jgi:hypothetical protein